MEADSQGVSVPGQLRVIGYGDQNFAKDTMPPLSTMRIDGTRIGSLAATMLLTASKAVLAMSIGSMSDSA